MLEQPHFPVRNSRVFASADYHQHRQPQPQHGLPMPPQAEGSESLACVHKHAGVVESMLLASILHVAWARPRIAKGPLHPRGFPVWEIFLLEVRTCSARAN